MADPLKVLREYALGERTLREVNQGDEKYLVFGDIAYPRDVKTNLTVYGKPAEYYALESLLFIWEKRDITHAAYVKEAAGKNIRAVTRPDRREILDYLKGDRQDVPGNFDLMAPIAPSIPASRFQDFEGPERKRPKLDSSIAKAPRIEELLKEGGPSADSGQDASELRALNENLTPDKIAALKKKMKNHQKRTATATMDDLEMDVSTEMSARMDMELKKRERVWKTRTNCLEAHVKQFTPILTLLQSLKVREETEARNKALGVSGGASSGARPGPDAHKGAANGPRKSNVGYSRYEQEQFNKDQLDFGIESEMTFVGQNFVGQKHMPDAKKAAGVTPSSLRGSAPSVSTTPVAPSPDTPKKRTSRTPIIIIPASTTANSLISMYNVRDVLQDMKFFTSEERKGTIRRENETLVQRRRSNTTVPYRVIDNPMKLTPEEWERVVAVFVMGPAWQFKGWTGGAKNWKGDPVKIFTDVAAFHLTYDTIKLDQNVARWSCKVIALSREKRHLDRARLQVFWDTLDRFIANNKPQLRF